MPKLSTKGTKNTLENTDNIIGLNSDDEIKQFPATLFKADNYQGKATTSTDPGTPENGDYWIASEDGTYTNFLDNGGGAIEASKLDKLVYRASGDYFDLFEVTTVDNAGTIQDIINAEMGRLPVYSYDGNDDYQVISDNPAIQNVFDDGGSIFVSIFPKSDGENNLGFVYSKGGIFLYCSSEGESKIKLFFQYGFSGDDGYWSTPVEIPLNQWSNIVVTYDNSDVANDPVIYLNNTSVSLTEGGAPTGTRTSDAGNDVYIGNNPSQTRTFDGYIGKIQLWNRILTTSDLDPTGSPIPNPAYENASNDDYESDFSSGADGFVSYMNTTVTGNEDGIGGEDDCMSIQDDTTDSYHIARKPSINNLVVGKHFRISFDYYLPSSNNMLNSLYCELGGGGDLILNNGTVTDTWTTVTSEQIKSTSNLQIDFWLKSSGSLSYQGTGEKVYIKNIKLIYKTGNVFLFKPKANGQKGWTGILGGEKFTAQNNGATPFNLPIDHAPEFYTDTFTTDIESGTGSKVIVQPAGYEVEDIIIIDKGTSGGLSAIQCTQETSSIDLLIGISVVSGETKSFRRSIADHNIYDSDKNLTFTATGNGGLGMRIAVKFRKVQ